MELFDILLTAGIVIAAAIYTFRYITSNKGCSSCSSCSSCGLGASGNIGCLENSNGSNCPDNSPETGTIHR